ncbi:hypothetical protein H8S95_16670 [Pontibacter sp. KCTC 32443]|uniref:hypothetical protein n=1 Tax=Pontibacter TaxID=323449 RepID=UPI00164D4534|nr:MULTISPECIES: hypothetical protein [Pontibacter]MBC5775714.1 hypothetical protein [Pontibacter sp. KCTC 32443]
MQLGIAAAKGFISGNEFREVVEACLLVIEEYKPLRWIGDNRNLRAIRKADQDWFASYVFPRLAASTIRRNATIVSFDVFNKMAVEQLLERAEDLGNMIVKDFDNEADALAWVSKPIDATEGD